MPSSRWRQHSSSVTGAAVLPRLRSALLSRYVREPLIVLLAYIPYFFARGLAVQNAEQAFDNASHLVRFERSIGIFGEISLQSATISYDFLLHAFNAIYFYGHWPIIISVGVYLFVKNPRAYVITRNAFLISGAIALVLYALFPVAPPRLSVLGVADTLQLTVPLSLDQSRLVNPFAALPSLHVGWDLIIALGIFVAIRKPFARGVALLLPPAMMLATVVTGNHFFVDGIAGAGLALAAFVVAVWLYRKWPAAQGRLVASLGRLRTPGAAPSP